MNNLLAGVIRNQPGKINNSLFEQGSVIESLGFSFDKGEFLQVFIPKFVGLLLVFGGVSFFFMFLWGAISYILSGGDKAHVESAKGRITSALIGVILMVAVFAIVKLIENFFDINILSIDIGPLIIE